MLRSNLYKALLAAGILLALLRCDVANFGDINDNPNAASEPITAALLTQALTHLGETHLLAGMYCQYITETQYTERARYTLWEYSFWLYREPLMDLENIIVQNTDEDARPAALNYGSHDNQIAVARILKVYYFSWMSDYLGDIPYREALTLDPQPVYDRQEDIYRDFFRELDEAVAQFDEGRPAEGDILFQGDIAKWKKFANSLRLILALRLSEVAPELGASQVAAALAEEEGVMEASEANAVLYFPGDDFQHPWYRNYLQGVPWAMTDVMEKHLAARNDPRLPVYGSPGDSGRVIGVPYGLPREMAIEFTDMHPDFARVLAPQWRQADSPWAILTSADVALARAEAAALGWTTEDAAALYEEGIRLSMMYWGVYDPTRFGPFMAAPGVDPGQGDLLDKIRFQRWVAFFPNGHQGWSLWRRTGVPDLQPTPWAVNTSGQIPRRFIYWTKESNLNPEHYREAVERLDQGDTMDSRVWWDLK